MDIGTWEETDIFDGLGIGRQLNLRAHGFGRASGVSCGVSEDTHILLARAFDSFHVDAVLNLMTMLK